LKPLAALVLASTGGGLAALLLHPLVGAAVGLAVYLLVWYGIRPEPEDLDIIVKAWAKLRGRDEAMR
ncbi:MAG: hypothetical protein ACP5VN_10565, partial [Acidobacteriota bacterium]